MNAREGIIFTIGVLSLFAGILYFTANPNSNSGSTYGSERVIHLGPEKEWDAEKVTSPTIIFDRSTQQYMMWYIGNGVLDRSGLGLATSSNGIDWSWDSSNLFEVTSSWAEGGLRSATVLEGSDGKYHMWFSAQEWKGDEKIAIGYAISTDGKNWQLVQEQPVLEGEIGYWDTYSVDSPSVLEINGTYYMWYTGYEKEGAEPAIGYATSTNGIQWNKQTEPVITETVATTGTRGVEDPHVISYNNGQLFEMWLVSNTRNEQTLTRLFSSNGTFWQVNDNELPLIVEENGSFTEPFVMTDASRDTFYIWMERTVSSKDLNEIHFTTWPKNLNFQFTSQGKNEGGVQELPDELPKNLSSTL